MSRYLHTMIRVMDLEQSVAFYTKLMGMKELRRNEVPGGRYTLCFVGYAGNPEQAEIELTYNWDQTTPTRSAPASAISPSACRTSAAPARRSAPAAAR